MRFWLPRMGTSVAGLGLVVMVIGTFLDWSRSGSVHRNSYDSIDVIGDIAVSDDSPLHLALGAWFGLAPVASICVAAYALGARRSAAGLSAVLAIITGTVSGVATIQGHDQEALVGLASTGPVVTLIGSVLVLTGATGVFVREHRNTSKTSGGES
jgi:hypothetical protein